MKDDISIVLMSRLAGPVQGENMETADVKDEEVAGAQPTREERRERHGAGAVRGSNDGLVTIMRA